MRALILATLVGLGLGAMGCTATQLQTAKDDLHTVVADARQAVAVAKATATPENLAKAQAAIAAVASKVQPLHNLGQSATRALGNAGTITGTGGALDTADAILAQIQAGITPSGTTPPAPTPGAVK